MTRPLGKPSARSRIKSTHPDLNQVSLVDVCAEDDSLLPGKGIASPQGSSGPTPCPRPGASPFKLSAMRTLACIQEDPPESEESRGTDEGESCDMLPALTIEEPAVQKKKKKSGFNLRKSLAWNNAFFTEEGVLDPDELSLVNRTFKKPLKEPKPSSNKKPAFASKILNTSAISKINFSPVRFQKPPSYGENRHHSAAPAQGSPLSSSGNASKRTDQNSAGVKGSSGSKHTTGPSFSRANGDTMKHVKSMLPTCTEHKPSPLKKQMEENPRIITSGPSSQARTSSKPPLNQPKQTQSISSTLSSASRMMKDRLGMVFAGRNVGNPKMGTKPAAEDDTVVPSHRIPEYSDSAKLARCYSHSSYERLGRSTVATSTEPTGYAASNVGTALESRASHLHGTSGSKGPPSSFSSSIHQGKEQPSGAFFSHSQGISTRYTRPPQQSALEATLSNTRDQGAAETLLSRAKPSGLRMPSPKLGFFDKARTTNATNVAILRERTNGLGYDGVSLQSARYVGATDLPSDVGKQSISHSYGVIPQASKTASGPITASTNANGLAKMDKPPIPSKNSSSEPQLEHGNGADGLPHIPIAPHLQFGNSSKPETSLGSTSGSQTGPCITESMPCSYSHGTCTTPAGFLPKTQEPTSLSSHTSGSDLSDTGTILQVKKNGQNVFPAVKKMVNKLNLSPLRITQQENVPLEHSQINGASQHLSPGNEKACSKGDCTAETQEEWPEVKSGAVQHSPPHKQLPKYGPWSPVRRNAPELTPFDCTKYTNNTAISR